MEFNLEPGFFEKAEERDDTGCLKQFYDTSSQKSVDAVLLKILLVYFLFQGE